MVKAVEIQEEIVDVKEVLIVRGNCKGRGGGPEGKRERV